MPFQTSPGGRRLRHLGLLRRRSALRHARRFRRIRAWRQAARHPRDHRPGRQSHVRRASVVSGGARAIRKSKYRDWYVWSKKKPAERQHRAWCSPASRNRRGRTTSGEALVLPSLLRFSARPQHSQSRSAGRNPEDHGVLDPARRVRLPNGCRAVRHRAPRGRRSQSRASNTTCCARSASSCSGAGRLDHSGGGQRAAAIPTWSISATPATACT